MAATQVHNSTLPDDNLMRDPTGLSDSFAQLGSNIPNMTRLFEYYNMSTSANFTELSERIFNSSALFESPLSRP